MATTAARPNTHDMVVVHRVFRREFRLMPALVRSVTPGDLGRAKTVANHATELTVALHHHHTGEDELLWPRLRERVDLGNVLDADLIDRMEAAHHEIATLLDQAGPMMPQLAARADESTRDELAQVFDQVS